MKTKLRIIADTQSSSMELTARQEADVQNAMQEYSDQQTKELRGDHNELITKYNSSNNMLCEYMMAIEEIIGFAGPIERVKEELNKLGKLREEIERLKEDTRQWLIDEGYELLAEKF